MDAGRICFRMSDFTEKVVRILDPANNLNGFADLISLLQIADLSNIFAPFWI